jgi:hypothetical protein
MSGDDTGKKRKHDNILTTEEAPISLEMHKDLKSSFKSVYSPDLILHNTE